MNAEEMSEYGRMVKVLDMAVARIVPPCWPLALPAVQLLREVEAVPYHCAMCVGCARGIGATARSRRAGAACD